MIETCKTCLGQGVVLSNFVVTDDPSVNIPYKITTSGTYSSPTDNTEVLKELKDLKKVIKNVLKYLQGMERHV